MASSQFRRMLSKLPLNPWINPRSPSNGNPLRFFDASTLTSASRFPVEIPTATCSNILRFCNICAGENLPFNKPEPSNQTILVAKSGCNAPILFKPYWVSSSQTLFLGMPTSLKLDSARFFSGSFSGTPKDHNVGYPLNPTQNPLPSGLEKTLEEFEKKFLAKGDPQSNDFESRRRAVDELRKALRESKDTAAIDAREAKKILESLRDHMIHTHDLIRPLVLLGLFSIFDCYGTIHMGEFPLGSCLAVVFPWVLMCRELKIMNIFERWVDSKMSPLSRAINVSDEIDQLSMRCILVTMFCTVVVIAELLLAH